MPVLKERTGMKKIELDDDALVAYYREVRSPRKTAAKFGIGLTTVERKLKQYGIERIGQRGMARKLPPSIKEEYESGLSMNQIARKYSATLASVAEALNRAGVDSRARGGVQKKITDEFRAECVRLYTERGQSQEEIARSFNTSQTRVSRALTASGIYSGTRAGSNHGSWRGGRSNAHGYVNVYVEQSDPMWCMATGASYVLEHRLVMARHLGRPLDAHETVHHINGDIKDNSIENLQLRNGKHGKGVAHRCRDCGSTNIESTRLH